MEDKKHLRTKGASMSKITTVETQEMITLKIDGVSGDRDLEREVANVMYDYFELWKTKQHDYGPRNVADFGEFGLLVRANDKFCRLKNLIKPGATNAVKGETRKDSWMDLMGYAINALVVLKGLWPGAEITEEQDGSND
jgi:hypothetical protein